MQARLARSRIGVGVQEKLVRCALLNPHLIAKNKNCGLRIAPTFDEALLFVRIRWVGHLLAFLILAAATTIARAQDYKYEYLFANNSSFNCIYSYERPLYTDSTPGGAIQKIIDYTAAKHAVSPFCRWIESLTVTGPAVPSNNGQYPRWIPVSGVSATDCGGTCTYGVPGAITRTSFSDYLYVKQTSVRHRYHDAPAQCRVNPGFQNPIFPLTGSRRNVIDIGSWMGISMQAGYDNKRKVPANDPLMTFAGLAPTSFGGLWETNLHKALIIQPSPAVAVQAARGLNAWVSFTKDGSGQFAPDREINDRLFQTADGWRYVEGRTQTVEIYNSAGSLISATQASGYRLHYTYSDSGTQPSVAPVAGLLIGVNDSYGRSIQMNYEASGASGSFPRLSRLIDPSGSSIGFSYDGLGNLRGISWPDGRSLQFQYENPALPWALTGMLDENGVRTGTYGYDANGRANETQGPNGVNHARASWSAPPSWNIVESYDSVANVIWRDHYWSVAQGTTITEPNGSVTQLQAELIQGKPALISRSQPAGSGCAESTSRQTYDASGNIASADDFNGHRTCHAYDLSRNLEGTRVEGLSNTATCTNYLPSASSLPTGSRKTSTQWHPDWRLRAKVAEPGRITTYVYNGQPDPFNGNATASCAPTSATLPDGKPIAVLCKQLEQATTDVNGSQGFSASSQSGVPNRVWQWTYNEHGQVLTGRDPLDNQTTNVYYTTTTTDYTKGDLQISTNAAGHVTSYPRYNKHGQVLQKIDPNGVVTDYTYELRQRLKTVTTAGQTTSYDYDAAGPLKRVTSPDGSYVAYDYDDAHRLVAVSDSAGNRIDYTLDNAGNRTAENVKDPSGALKRQLARAMDALGRVQQTTGRE